MIVVGNISRIRLLNAAKKVSYQIYLVHSVVGADMKKWLSMFQKSFGYGTI